MGRKHRNDRITWLKIVLSAMFGILLADALELEYAMSAGVIAILTIQPTKKETISTALGRLYAFLIALCLAGISFKLFGITYTAYFLFLFLYIFICQIMGWHSAMGMNSVLISHFISSGSMSVSAVRNEVMIFAIGVGIGILANLHLRKRVETIERLMDETDEQMIQILRLMAVQVRVADRVAEMEKSFLHIKEHMEEAKEVAEENYNNQWFCEDIYDMEYLNMREKQCLVLYEMYKTVRLLKTAPHTAEKLAVYLEKMADVFERKNNGRDMLCEFSKLDVYMKGSPLPVEREEFEDRARLFALMRHIEEFIYIKMEFANRFG